MCAIVGFYFPPAVWPSNAEEVINSMADSLQHRGPDSGGIWLDPISGIGIAHRRLSIMDLSAAGHQPMESLDSRWIISFNGEIYNHLVLRAELDILGWAGSWRGKSDTETLLAAIQVWGLPNALSKLNGMFAFSLWDRHHQKLYLVRDRLGEKPLYYGYSNNLFLYASELKAMTFSPGWKGEINRDVLALYLRHAYIPDPYCIYKGIFKLPPAHWVEVTNGRASEPQRYWSLDQYDVKIFPARTDGDLINELEVQLLGAVNSRMSADVPLGAFLSGGIDSSLIVALMQAQSSSKVKTFTIGFDESRFNEATYAKGVASHLGTDHTELYITSDDALKIVPELPEIWDEPFADSSQIPTLLLSRLTRKHVVVALSGDGGDELFCGYSRYNLGYKFYKWLHVLPPSICTGLGRILQDMPSNKVGPLLDKISDFSGFPAVSDRLTKLGGVLASSKSEAEFYRALISLFQTPEFLVIGAQPIQTLLDHPDQWPRFNDIREEMMYLDTKMYLPGDILTKVDRATMSVGLEARVPLLDHTLVEFAASLPLSLKVGGGQGKKALRQILSRYIPVGLIDRPKMGFGVPIDSWLSGPLNDWAESLLSEKRLEQEGYFNAAEIRRLWNEHKSGRRRWHHQLWSVLMFQAWLEHQAVIS